MKASLISLFCLLILPLASADPTPPIVPPPGQPGQPVQQPPVAPLARPPRLRGGGVQGGNDNAFDHNRSISLIGNVGENRDINLAITGIGPTFNSDCIIGDGTILSVQYNTTETEDAIQVNYSIGLQVEVKTGNRGEYRSLTFNGRVLCKEGTPVQIYKNGSQTLSLGVDLTKKDDEKK